MSNIEIIEWYLRSQDIDSLISLIEYVSGEKCSSYSTESCINKIKEMLSSCKDISKLQDLKSYVELQKSVRKERYYWTILCDLNLNYNKEIIAELIGYKDSTTGSAKVDYTDDYVESLKKEIISLKMENSDLTKIKEEALNERDILKKEFNDANSKLEKVNSDFGDLKCEYDRLKACVENLKKQNEYLRNRKSYTSETINYTNDKDAFNAFVNNAVSWGLNYSSDDLINFYTSVKSAKFTIIEGISGTGKSKLVSLYASTLGLDTNNRIIFVPVSPGWTDDTDILGFLDTNTMKYKEASIGLVSFLLEASKHPDKPYLICFDEMNLAKVEYYFAQFLSVLENDVSSRVLRIYNPKDEDEVINSMEYPAEIRLGENLIFCGTINVDESTYRLSDKVLDRANLIRLQYTDFSESEDEKPAFKIIDVTLSEEKKVENLTVDELSTLDILNEKLKAINSRFSYAHRVVNQIRRYLNAIPDNDINYDRQKALDRLIVQKILSKIRGTEEQVGRLIGSISDDNYVPGIVDECLNVNGVVEYPFVRKALKEKAKELNNYGYIG